MKSENTYLSQRFQNSSDNRPISYFITTENVKKHTSPLFICYLKKELSVRLKDILERSTNGLRQHFHVVWNGTGRKRHDMLILAYTNDHFLLQFVHFLCAYELTTVVTTTCKGLLCACALHEFKFPTPGASFFVQNRSNSLPWPGWGRVGHLINIRYWSTVFNRTSLLSTAYLLSLSVEGREERRGDSVNREKGWATCTLHLLYMYIWIIVATVDANIHVCVCYLECYNTGTYRS